MPKPTNNQEKAAQFIEYYKQAVINKDQIRQDFYKRKIVSLVFSLEKQHVDFCNMF